MNPGGVVLIIAGAWVLTQVFGGDVIGRLNLNPDTPPAATP